MKLFKLAAESYGYALWYDPTMKSWVLTKEGVETEYFDAGLLTQMGLVKFVQVFLRQN